MGWETTNLLIWSPFASWQPKWEIWELLKITPTFRFLKINKSRPMKIIENTPKLWRNKLSVTNSLKNIMIKALRTMCPKKSAKLRKRKKRRKMLESSWVLFQENPTSCLQLRGQLWKKRSKRKLLGSGQTNKDNSNAFRSACKFWEEIRKDLQIYTI